MGLIGTARMPFILQALTKVAVVTDAAIGRRARLSPQASGCFSARRPNGWRGLFDRKRPGRGRWGLPRFVWARKDSALGADDGGVRQKIVCLLAAFLVLVPQVMAESALLIRKRVSEVRLTLVATDRNDRPLLHLSPADITVLEDGQPVPSFELRSAADLPLRIAIVLDLSDSTRRSWVSVRGALTRSLGQLMRSGDQLMVLAFNNKIQLESIVEDPAKLDTVLKDQANGGLTALYDTLFEVCARPVFSDNRDPHRSALILFSDGEDDLSAHGLAETVARAQRTGVAVYTVAAHNPKKLARGDAVLQTLAANTGGRDFIVKDSAQLGKALSEINDELRSSYLLYYRVPELGVSRAFRKVHVIPTQRDGARVRSRTGYFISP
jgi:Ca-activated chloride channel family protein